MSMGGSRKNLLTEHAAYATRGKATVPTGNGANNQLLISYAQAHNRSGGAIDLGVLSKLVNGNWRLYQAESPQADLTSSIQGGSSTQIFGTTNNNGIIIESPDKFNLIGITVSQAEAGSPVYAYQYWNGSSYVTSPNISVQTAFTVADGINLLLSAVDWATKASLRGDGLQVYTIRILATTAPSTAVLGTNMWLGKLLDFSAAVANNAKLELNFPPERPLLLEGGESIMYYFGTANAANCVATRYQINE